MTVSHARIRLLSAVAMWVVLCLSATAGAQKAAANPDAGATSAPTAPAPSAAATSETPPAAASAKPASPGATPVASGSQPASAGAVDGATYAVRLRDLEQRIDELKERIRRSHTRLSMLSDTILGGGVAGSRADISFVNDLSSAFRLTRAVFVLDGAVQYNKTDDTGALSQQKTLPIYTGSIPPGDHTLVVLLELRGHGYGVFSYLRGYRFQVRSSHSFTVMEGKSASIQAIAFEKGGVTTPLEERPTIRYAERLGTAEAESVEPAAPNKAGASVSVGASVGGK